jgi:hypothetical protein
VIQEIVIAWKAKDATAVMPTFCITRRVREMDETSYQIQRLIAAWIQTGGVFIATAVFVASISRSRLDSRLRVYDAGHDGWIRFLQIAAEHPHLGLLDPEGRRASERPREDREVETAAYLMLLAVLQREYYLARKTRQRSKSSTLLARFAETYVSAPEFIEAYTVSKFLYRPDFIQWLERLHKNSSSP